MAKPCHGSPAHTIANPSQAANLAGVTTSAISRNPDIAHLVASFYASARADGLIGPVFNAVVTDWPHHLASLTAFWAAQLRGRGVYRGAPLAAHLAHGALIRPAMFERWLALWAKTAQATMPPDDAATLIARAHAIAESLRAALADSEAR